MKSDNIIKIPFITGPTASGKSSVAHELALEFGFEIISCDSRQIYRNMNIGTAKPSDIERKEVKHHLIDIINPSEKYSSFKFAKDALEIIQSCATHNQKVLLCGGTGLYFEALSKGIGAQVETDKNLILFYTEMAEKSGRVAVYSELKKCDPKTAERLHENDLQRVIRALAVYKQSGQTLSEIRNIKNPPVGIEFTPFIFSYEKEILYNRINNRVNVMIKMGLYDEFLSLIRCGYDINTPGMRSVGYQEFFPLINKVENYSMETAVEKIKQASRKYAKRQSTWFRNRLKGVLINPKVPDFKNRFFDKIKKGFIF